MLTLRRAFFCLLLGWLLAGGAGGAQAPDAAAGARLRQARALMERFDFAAAEQVLAALERDYREWREVRLDRAIAILNRRGDADPARALGLVEALLKDQPGQPRGQYLAGLLRLSLGEPEAAAPHFYRVTEADPQDAYAAYFLAQSLERQDRHEEALLQYRRALALDPLLRSACYGAFQALQQLGRGSEARNLLEEYQRLARDPGSKVAEFRYTRMGPKAEIQDLDPPQDPAPAVPKGPRFDPDLGLTWAGEAQLLWSSAVGARPPADLTVTDWNQDGYPDLFLPNVLLDPRAPNLVLEGQPGGGFRSLPDHPLAQVPDVNAALWGDLDSDGLLDVYLCRRGGNQLWRQIEPNHWEDISQSSGTGGEQDTRGGALFDADQDGDLDLFLVNADGPNELLNNNRDGTFRPLAEERGIGGNGLPSTQVLPVDLDGDRDLDLVVLHQEPPHEVYRNDRLWSYHPAAGFDAFVDTPALAVIALDQDANGQTELFSLTPDGRLLRWMANGAEQWVAAEIARLPAADWAQLGVLDGTGEGVAQILAVTQNGWWLIDAKGQVAARGGQEAERGWRGAVPLLTDPARGPGVLGLGFRGGLRYWPPGAGRQPYLHLTLSGQSAPIRSNAAGIGARVAVRTGKTWRLAPEVRAQSGPGQGMRPLSLGLGGAAQADQVTITWPDGTFQTQANLAAGRLQRITETRRSLAGGPVLFAWDGSRYAFVSDLLRAGSLGAAVGPGEYAPVRPWENLPLAEGMVQPQDGRFRFRLTEAREEVTYVDGARLVIWELPPGWRVALDERLGVLEPKPTGAAFFYREEWLPVRAWNEREEDVLAQVRDLDGQAPPPGPLDDRFIGRLAGEHVLTLEFEKPLDGHPGNPVLVADGWRESPYSQTLFAAWQAGADYWAPTLEARDKDGEWQPLREQFGYPAGMRRRISVPLGQVPPGTQSLRIRSNMEIHWDRLAIALAEPQPAVRRHELFPVAARVAKVGFPACRWEAESAPGCDYDQRAPFADIRSPAGHYSRYGEVLELLAETDDALAILAPGDQLELEYAVPQVPPAPQWTRHYVLEINGWVKDMDLYTRDGETVAPLPESGLPADRRDQLHPRFNTRYQDGY